MSHPAKTKPPSFKIYADDLTVEEDEKTYYPHAGEWVKLIRCKSSRLYLFGLKQATRDHQPGEKIDKGEMEELQADYKEVCQLLAKYVVDWNWTGPDGNLLPKPGYESILDLGMEETLWLLQAVQGGRATEKKPSSGSTGA